MASKYDDEFDWDNPDHLVEMRQSTVKNMQSEAFIWGFVAGGIISSLVTVLFFIRPI
jgi:hypothetical protein